MLPRPRHKFEWGVKSLKWNHYCTIPIASVNPNQKLGQAVDLIVVPDRVGTALFRDNPNG